MFVFQQETYNRCCSLMTSTAQQELRSKREQEVATLKKALEDEAGNHESQLSDMRHKNAQEISSINEQLESIKKVKTGLEKAKQTLEAENADLATELRNVNQSRQENDRRRKQAETLIAELQVCLGARIRLIMINSSVLLLSFV